MSEGGQPAGVESGGGARTLTASDIAAVVGGTVRGDGSAVVRAVAPLDRAGPHELSFLAAARYAPLFEKSGAGVVLVAPELADSPGTAQARVVVDRPHEALLGVLPRLYAPRPRVPGVDATARVGRGAAIGEGAEIGPYAVVGAGASVGARTVVGAHAVIGDGVSVGEDCVLHPGCTLYPGTRLGRRVIVHSGARLGSDGFGYVFRDGQHAKIPHVGRCIVEDDVEIGANCGIDRGSIDDTVIGAGTKIDNLVHVAHNVRIGRLCLLMAQAGIAGSTRIGDGVIVAGQAGIAGHVTIGDGARIGAQAGAFGDVPARETWSGYPARPHRESLRAHAALLKLAGMVRGLERLLAERPDAERPDAERRGA